MVAWFFEDDAGYVAWLRANPSGFVVNCEREPKARYVVFHRAGCSTISGTPSNGGSWTSAYAKACASTRAELERWCVERTGRGPTACGRCAD